MSSSPQQRRRTSDSSKWHPEQHRCSRYRPSCFVWMKCILSHAMYRMKLITSTRCRLAACARHSSALKTTFSSRVLHGPATKSNAVGMLLLDFYCMKAVTALKRESSTMSIYRSCHRRRELLHVAPISELQRQKLLPSRNISPASPGCPRQACGTKSCRPPSRSA